MLIDDYLSQSPHINGVVIPSLGRTRSGHLYRSVESRPPFTQSEVEERTEPKPRQAKQANHNAQPNLILRHRRNSILRGTEKLTPPQPHKGMAPSTPHPPTPPYPHAHAIPPADPPSPSLPHSQPYEIGCAPVREPPAWRLNYKIGTGAYGNVFLEHVQRPEIKYSELWAVKRIPKALQNFTPKQYKAEINNLHLLARVSFA